MICFKILSKIKTNSNIKYEKNYMDRYTLKGMVKISNLF